MSVAQHYLNMVNQAFRIKIAYRSREKEEKEKKKEEENTRDRSVPDGSDNKISSTKSNPAKLIFELLMELCHSRRQKDSTLWVQSIW